MKTLAEVIKNLEDGTEHLSAMLISRETWSDTLHYLQEYKAKMKVLEYKSKRYDEMCETIQKQGQEPEDDSHYKHGIAHWNFYKGKGIKQHGNTIHNFTFPRCKKKSSHRKNK